MTKLFVTKVIDQLTDVIVMEEENQRVMGVVRVKEELKNISRNLKIIEILLNDAEKRRLWETYVCRWLQRVEDSTYKMEDVLNECNLKILRQNQLKAQEQAARETRLLKKVSSVIPSLRYFLKKIPDHRDIALKIKDINWELEHMLEMGNRSIVLPAEGRNVDFDKFRLRHSISIVDASKVQGLDLDKETLLKHLVHENKTSSSSTEVIEKDKVKVISIVGVGGGGKTTLAKILYNDDRVKEHFEVRRWVCLSDPFDTIGIAKDILRSPEKSNADNVSDLESVFQLMKDFFSGKRFLVVFDDVWTEIASEGEPFRDSLKDGAPGSIILVTTRSEEMASLVGSHYQHHLRPLSKSDCWSIIKRMALPKEESIPKEVERIGKKIAKQCKGSPLIAKIVGGLLRAKRSKPEWTQVLDNEILRMEVVTTENVSNYYLIYQQLSPELKVCFSYCALFPKDTGIDVEKLERLWAAVGCVSSNRANEDMEKTGYECLKDLETRSLIGEVKSSIHKNKMTSCKIPQLFHLGLQYSSAWKDRKPRCFLIRSPSQALPHHFARLKYLRALVILSCCQLEQVPSEVGKLTFLKYLDLSGNPLRQLPEIICSLIFLESLDVHGCYLLLSLPQRIGELEQLRHLRINYTADKLHYNLPQGFWKLALIQALDVIKVGGRYNNIAKLRHFKDLEDVRIVIHGEVHFEDAKLDSKLNLENLELCFTGEGRDLGKASLIEGLKPPPRLQMLKMEGYPGLKLPRWIVGVTLVKCLRRLSLKSALNISSLPSLWKLSCLHFLWLYDLPNLKHLGLEFFGPRKAVHAEKQSQKTQSREDEIVEEAEVSSSDLSEDDDEETNVQERSHPEEAEREVAFPKLETLRVEYLENWETWEDLKENQISVMPKLKDLHIHGCPNLKALPPFILGKRSHGLSIITAEPKLLPVLSIPGTSKAAGIKE